MIVEISSVHNKILSKRNNQCEEHKVEYIIQKEEVENRREQLIKAFGEVGKAMLAFGNQAEYASFSKLIDPSFYERFNAAIEKEHVHNGWFTAASIRNNLKELGGLLTYEELKQWSEEYEFAKEPVRVGIIMAGNIPLVGFHDFLCVLFSGHKALVKMSSEDTRLFPFVLELIEVFFPEITQFVEIHPRLKDLDAVIATGSDNSARYFEKYFGHVPNIIRKNRTSIAVLDGSETKEELALLGKDIFLYFGLGCRNISKVFVPQDFNLDRMFEAILPYSDIINHHKYANNYDYYKAIYLMNQHKIIENGFLLTMESEDLFAPISVLYTKRYSNLGEVDEFIEQYKEKIQAIIGHGYLSFGQAQSPSLEDYADGVNTMKFLERVR